MTNSEVHNVPDESVVADSLAVGVESEAENRLRLPDPEELKNLAGDYSQKDLEIFCKTGLLPHGTDSRKKVAYPIVPAILQPYVSKGSRRYSWPVVAWQTTSGLQVESLSEIVDALIRDIGDAGDSAELQRRGFLRLEGLIAESFDATSSHSIGSLFRLLEPAMKSECKEKEDRLEAVDHVFTALRSRVGDAAKCIGFGASGLEELMVSASVRVGDSRSKAFQDDLEWLTSRLEDLIRVEEQDSDLGHTPERLEHSVGGAYTDAIDFGSLAHLLDEAPHGAALDPTRLLRIQHTLELISDLSRSLFGKHREKCMRTCSTALNELSQRTSDFTDLARARQIALLEIENGYRAEVHDPLFEAFSYDSIPVVDRKAFPPVLVHLTVDSSEDVQSVYELMQTATHGGIARILVTYSHLLDEQAGTLMGLDLARMAVSRGDLFVQQAAASQTAFVTSGIQLGARSRGSSLQTVFTGFQGPMPGLDAYLMSGIASDSRTVPSFRFDPEAGDAWKDWFSAPANEQSDKKWAESELPAVDSSESVPDRVCTTPADLMVLDARFGNHFVISNSEETDKLTELSDYLDLNNSARLDRMPFVWVSSENMLLKALVSPVVVGAVSLAARRWSMIREWSGLKSSILQQGLKQQEIDSKRLIDEAIAAAQAEFDDRMSQTTTSLAQHIVENIAASLLGEGVSAMPAGTRAPKPKAPNGVKATAPKEPQEAQSVPEKAEPEPAVVEEEDDDLGLSLDEAYIDTPLCTSCNECTDLNSLIFGYNENKQAYIKDASAGPYRDLVIAAEKCPVKIIHPGKPLDPNEKFLDELVARAKPYL